MKDIEFIIKKMVGQLNEEEEILFQSWLKKTPDNEVLYQKMQSLKGKGKDISKLIDLDVENAWEVVLHKNLLKNKKFRIRNILKYAAIFIGIIGASFFIYSSYFSQNAPEQNLHAKTDLVVNKDEITLKMDDGKIEIIKIGENKELLNHVGKLIGEQKGGALHYESNLKLRALSYNELTVPYGRQLCLYLSDGTKVNLNSGTKFKYPVNFIANKNREVFLNGEAYFEVAKDEVHPFIVNTKNLNVKVLGTKFNVAAYEDELITSAVLLEGNVIVNAKGLKDSTAVYLTPGYMASINETDSINVEMVDVSKYVAWMEDAIVFIDITFMDITRKLERKYGVDIICDYEVLNHEKYTGRFDSESVLQILESFSYDIPFDYIIEGDRIIISEPINNDDKKNEK